MGLGRPPSSARNLLTVPCAFPFLQCPFSDYSEPPHGALCISHPPTPILWLPGTSSRCLVHFPPSNSHSLTTQSLLLVCHFAALKTMRIRCCGYPQLTRTCYYWLQTWRTRYRYPMTSLHLSLDLILLLLYDTGVNSVVNRHGTMNLPSG
jgi:hypothetical protein